MPELPARSAVELRGMWLFAWWPVMICDFVRVVFFPLSFFFFMDWIRSISYTPWNSRSHQKKFGANDNSARSYSTLKDFFWAFFPVPFLLSALSNTSSTCGFLVLLLLLILPFLTLKFFEQLSCKVNTRELMWWICVGSHNQVQLYHALFFKWDCALNPWPTRALNAFHNEIATLC